MNTFSFSRLSLYETCPHRFYKRYVEGLQEPTTYPLALGKGVHRAVEDKMNGLSHQEAVVNGFIEAELHPEVTKQELSWLTNNAPIHQIQGETEIYFKIPLADEDDAPLIQGFIDVVGNNYIVDWKTNRVMYDVRENNQIGLYAWAMNKVRGMEDVYGRLYFLRFRRESNFRYTFKEMESARSWAYNLAKEIQGKLALAREMPELKDDLFPATPSSFCSHCPFAVSCFRKFSPVSDKNKGELVKK